MKPWEKYAEGDGPWAKYAQQAEPEATQPKPAAVAPSRAERIGMGMVDPIQGGAQLLTQALPAGVVQAGNRVNNWLADKTGLVARLPEGGVDQQTREREAAYQARREAAGEGGFDGWRLAGNIVSPANAAIGAAAPVRAVSSLGGRAAVSGATGSAASALAPVTEGDSFWAEKAKQVALGFGFGAVTPAMAAGVGRGISPKASVNPDVQMLRAEGVKGMTLGQALGGRFNAAEEKLQSLPIMGDMIARSRGRALEQFNQAAINRATAPVGATTQGVGQKGVEAAGDAISDAYTKALAGIKAVKLDDQFAQEFGQLKRMAQAMTPEMRNKFNTTARDALGGRVSQVGGMTPEAMKRADSELGQMAARYSRSAVASEQELGNALRELQAQLRRQVARNAPAGAQALREADSAWANLVRVEGAAKAAKNNGGVFTPAQLNAAVQQADNSVRKRSVARGTALMQDLANAGQNVLGNKVPNSGTFDRAAMGAGTLGAGFYFEPTIAASLLAGGGAYTSVGQRLLTEALLRRPSAAQPVANALYGASPVLGPANALLAVEAFK